MPKRKTIITRLDDLFRKAIRLRDHDTCQRCGIEVHGRRSQVSHVVERKYYRLRWDMNNAKLLCPQCHGGWFEPLKATLGATWFRNKWPDRAAYLDFVGRPKAETWRDDDLEGIEQYLHVVIAELERNRL